nr:hypothetical protein [Tanacetum cinerariifolium]
MEKIFDVMSCEDAFKRRLDVYKFEGSALAWWKAYKQAKGGDAWLVTMTWADFKKLFFLQFFPRAEQERLKREYHSIRQTNTETSTESTLNYLMCMSYKDVAQVANAARNYEILHERDDEDTERPDKRQKSGDRHQPTSQQSSHRNHCRRAAGTCFKCGQAGHLQKDCKKNTTAGTSGQADKKPGASGRVFAITEGYAANTSSTIT